jgi:hypothetical protein
VSARIIKSPVKLPLSQIITTSVVSALLSPAAAHKPVEPPALEKKYDAIFISDLIGHLKSEGIPLSNLKQLAEEYLNQDAADADFESSVGDFFEFT